jgi:hypothetical protein
MKKQILPILFFSFLTFNLSAQFGNIDQKYSLSFGAGLFTPFLDHEGVNYANAEFDPQTSSGISYFGSFDYAISEKLAIGVGFNGNYGTAEFIRNANVNGTQIDGYLEAGAIANSHFLLNLTYTGDGEGIQPYARIGLGYFFYQAEMGDVPMELTGGVEEEIFPDFKYNGLGIIPEIGLRFNAFSLTAAYSLPFGELEGEEVPGGYISPGRVNLSGLQVNLAYRIGLFGN